MIVTFFSHGDLAAASVKKAGVHMASHASKSRVSSAGPKYWKTVLFHSLWLPRLLVLLVGSGIKLQSWSFWILGNRRLPNKVLSVESCSKCKPRLLICEAYFCRRLRLKFARASASGSSHSIPHEMSLHHELTRAADGSDDPTRANFSSLCIISHIRVRGSGLPRTCCIAPDSMSGPSDYGMMLFCCR